MRNFILEQSSSEVYTPSSGLALGGLCLNNHTISKRHGITNIDSVRTYMGLMLAGKSDFDTVDLGDCRT